MTYVVPYYPAATSVSPDDDKPTVATAEPEPEATQPAAQEATTAGGADADVETTAAAGNNNY